MDDGKQLWSIWRRLLFWFSGVFTRPGCARFAQMGERHGALRRAAHDHLGSDVAGPHSAVAEPMAGGS
jgi:hypothetical protein